MAIRMVNYLILLASYLGCRVNFSDLKGLLIKNLPELTSDVLYDNQNKF